MIDVDNSFPLPGANIYWEGNKTAGVVSNLEGEFEISVVDLPANLTISFVGYQTSIRAITEKDVNKTVKIFLRPDELSLDEVLIQELRPDQNIRSLETGKNSVPIQTIKNIPALFGEVDLLRSLQLLPGVQTAGEGTTGLFVRGGSADQNLVQIDGAPVYNPSHFFWILFGL